MELRHLRYFLAVAEELHFGRAAQRLCIAQPPLSQQIQQLERELGFALFLRANRQVRLTEAGETFLEETRVLFAGLEKAIHAGRRIARGEVGWLSIGFVGTATYALLPAVLPVFRERYPGVELALRELVSARQLQALRDRRIHVGFTRPALHEEDIASETVAREPLMAALPEAHPLASSESLPMRELAEEPFVLFPAHPKPSYADFLTSVCEQAGFLPQVVQEAAEMHTAISLVVAGIGITLVPASARNLRRPGVVYRPLRDPAPVTELSLAWRRDDSSPVLHAFLQIAREVSAGSQV